MTLSGSTLINLDAVGADQEYRIGLGLRPQYSYLNSTLSNAQFFGINVKGFFRRDDRWEIGIGMTPSFGYKMQFHRLEVEHVYNIGRFWDDPRWTIRTFTGFNLWVDNEANIDRSGYLVGSSLGFRLPWNLGAGSMDVYGGGFYSGFTSQTSGWALELGVQWTYATRREH